MALQDYLNIYFIFTSLAFWALIVKANYKPLKNRIFRKRRFKHVIDELKRAAKALEDSNGKSTAELTYRDKEGKLAKALITIDPAADNVFSEEDFAALSKSGLAGNIDAVLGGDSPVSKKMMESDNFVFSAKNAAQMRAMGIEPEDIVVQILKATGKMA